MIAALLAVAAFVPCPPQVTCFGPPAPVVYPPPPPPPPRIAPAPRMRTLHYRHRIVQRVVAWEKFTP